jgi:opacity protein-like surface antigen
MKRFAMLFAVLALTIGAAFGQVSVNGSYQFSRVYVDGAVQNTDPGYNLSLNIPVFKSSFGLLTEMTATTSTVGGTEIFLKTYGEGIQFQPRQGKFFRPYVNAVLGDAHFVYGPTTQNKLAVTTGAGADFALSKHWALRGGVEYLHTGVDGTNFEGIRPIGGLTFRF